MCKPVVVLLAVDVSVAGEARELGGEGQLAVAAAEAGRVPLPVRRQEEVAVADAASAARAASRLQSGPRQLALLQHLCNAIQSNDVKNIG